MRSQGHDYRVQITIQTHAQTGTVGFRRRQFPVRLAYASTSNSLQGGDYTWVGLDATGLFFAHGQLYVTSSRVARRDAFAIAGLPEVPGTDRPAILNVVHHDMINLDTSGRLHVRAPNRPERPRQRVPLLDLGDDEDDEDDVHDRNTSDVEREYSDSSSRSHLITHFIFRTIRGAL